MDLRLFFSWQSDSDTKRLLQTRFIRNSIKAAIAVVNKELKHVNIEYEESIARVPGTPDIAPEIEKRISMCHIFVGDYTFINQETTLSKLIKKLRGKKYKITPNPNVIQESSLFMARPFMKYQGLYVLNSLFGDPGEDESLMYFDQRGKRFPISFYLKEYNDNTPKESYQEEQKNFITALANKIKECAEQAVFHLEADIKPFYNWDGHKLISGFEGGYIVNGLEPYLQQIRDNKDNLRICGLSGLGKTRMVLETFKDDSIRYLYAYIDCQEHDAEEILEKTTFMFKHYKEMVLVFDNCDIELHSRIVRVKRSNHAINPIITIYNDPDENSTYYSTPLKLQKDFNEVVERILERFKSFYKPEDKEKLLIFAGGIPMMAQLLVEGLRNGDPLGVVSDSALMNKILDASENSEDREIMRTLSLFDYIGFEDDLHKELEFVATTKCITNVDKNREVIVQDFDKVVQKYLKRKIIERKGRLIGVRPTPIALYLISEWIEQCSDARLLAVIKAIQESDIAKALTDSFADQFRYMGHNEKARMMLDKLLGKNSPFGNAEVINTNLGSRLFRSFVEVNPDAVADCLWGVIGSSSINDLRLIDEGRRNLVWSIEKLCFEPRTFDKGAEMMLLLAIAENEQISNNATGQFTALFPIILPATAATLEQRLSFLTNQARYNDRSYWIMNALGRALHTRDYIFFSGAEKRGTQELNNYLPKTNKEIIEYLQGCLDLLLDLVQKNNSLLDMCCEILERNLGCLCDAGYGSIVIPYVQKIAELKKYDWEKMLDSIRFVLCHKAIKLTDEQRVKLEEMITMLSNNDFYFRFSQVGKKNRWLIGKDSYEDIIKMNNEDYEKLAKEMAENKLYTIDTLCKIYSFESYFGRTFGSVVAKCMSPSEQTVFIDNSISSFKSLSKFSFSIFIDFIREVEEQVFVDAFKKMKSLGQKSVLYASVSARGYRFNSDYVETLFQMVRDKQADVVEFVQMWRYLPIDSYSEDDIIYLFTRILQLPNSFLTVSHMSMILFGGSMKDETHRVLKFIEAEIVKRFDSFIEYAKDDDYWLIIKRVLEDSPEDEFVKQLILKIIDLIGSIDSISYRNYNVEDCLRILINKYFDIVWPGLSEALISDGEKYMLYYNLKSILSTTTNYNGETGILFQTNHNNAFVEWCAKYPNTAPERLMLMAPLYEEDNFSDIVIKLIDLYGNQDKVLLALSSNMGSFSYVGSIVPLYQKQYKCVEKLLSNKAENVRIWAVKMLSYLKQQIEDEKNRDAEGYLGYR